MTLSEASARVTRRLATRASCAADHRVDVTQLVQGGPKAPLKGNSGFELVSDQERIGLPTSEPKPYLLGVGDVLDVKVLLPTNQQGVVPAIR